MTVTFLKMATDTQTQKYRVTPPSPRPQHWFNSSARHLFKGKILTESPTEGATPCHISPQRPPTQAVPEWKTMIKVNRIVHFSGCAVTSRFHLKGEPIQDKMNWKKVATFNKELGAINLKSGWIAE